ncbi:hypothetical protein DFJ74DRAFT_643555 [Hyaloraphidium curvatum]|nr:hypothetical protein DFJ74DRAFT_643555 [Hyaloraphidium curvatum]
MEDEDARQQRAIRELGRYLLGGWVMTDTECGRPRGGGARCEVPLMRSKDGAFAFCALCAPVPPGASAWDSGETLAAAAAGRGAPAPARIERTEEDALEAEIGAVQQRLRSEARGEAEVPVERAPESRDAEEGGADEDMNEPASYDTTRAREQSDRAARLIGQRMLSGWALLGDTCTNPDCIGIPLIRNRQREKLCVICETLYPAESSQPAPQADVPAEQPPLPVEAREPPAAAASSAALSPSKRRASSDGLAQPDAKRLRSDVQHATAGPVSPPAPGSMRQAAAPGATREALTNHLDVLNARLASLSLFIAEQPLPMGDTSALDESCRLVDAISTCSRAIKELSDL